MTAMEMSPDSAQRMMLTAKMLLSMHVLQLNIMDLRVFLRAELEENPILEEEEIPEPPADDNEAELDSELSRLIDEEEPRRDLPAQTESRDYGAGAEKRGYSESLITKKESLYEHLHWQLNVLSGNDEEKQIGEFIIGNLDDNGFLNMELDRMRQLINADTGSFKRVLTLVRSFDPSGVGARNLKESLLLQLISSGKGDTHLYRIVYSHLEDLEKGYYEKIAHALSIPIKEVEIVKKRLSYFNPRPAASFGGQEAASIVPDVFLIKNNGTYEVEVNEKDLPRIIVSRHYKTMLKNGNVAKAAKEYIKKKILNGKWLIDAIGQRKKTIADVCAYLFEIQNDFLKNGEIAVKPLILKQVADELAISEATVSRAISNKYVQLSNRLLKLKDFFARKIETSDGGIVSDKLVKQKMQELIETEDIKSPLSDEEITLILNKEGIGICRRTVAKYRESLRIFPSYRRRK